jgi:dihydroorotase
MATYDTLITNGELVDPGASRFGRYDVAITGGRVAAVAPSIDRGLAASVIDAAGQIVTPGLIDLHTHIYWGVTYWGIEADPVAARTGVTTWVDVGSAGAYTFPGFREYVCPRNRARIYAFLNLSVIGLVAHTWEFANLDYCDVDLSAAMIDAHRDVILGVKARIDRNTTRGTGIRPLELARELADRVRLPLMVHISSGPPDLAAILDLLRPGDILTHCFTGGDHRLIDEHRRVLPAARALRERGVILDVGHGAGSFSYESTEAALADGLVPDVISSDIHQLSVQGPAYDLPTTLSKFLNLGMTLPQVIACATHRPAAALRRPDLGILEPGSAADIALFRLEEGDHTFFDVQMRARTGSARLVNTLTMIGGTLLARRPERARALWAVLPDHQRQVLQP